MVNSQQRLSFAGVYSQSPPLHTSHLLYFRQVPLITHLGVRKVHGDLDHLIYCSHPKTSIGDQIVRYAPNQPVSTLSRVSTLTLKSFFRHFLGRPPQQIWQASLDRYCQVRPEAKQIAKSVELQCRCSVYQTYKVLPGKDSPLWAALDMDPSEQKFLKSACLME